MRYKTITVFFLALVILIPCQSSFPKTKTKSLPPKYQEWLKLVSYIIQPEEKDVFMQLANNKDRDLFINIFWKQRDPTPGTPQNEYKDEHIKRFLYANKYYGRGTSREGWMTDMGRMYIRLGPPVSIERFEGAAGIYPCQSWSYYGDKSKGLPTHFNLLFFQRNGAGEYKLYNSLRDGPAALLIDKKNLDLDNYRELYRKIKELAPTLAGTAISMIPGEYSYDFRPSLQDNFILAKIVESSKKDINPSYATHFLNYKGIVSTEYLTNFVNSEFLAVVIRDPILNINFVHFSLSPEKVSIDYFKPKDQYYCNFQLNVSVRKKDEVIFQYSKDFPFYFDPQNAEQVRGSGIALQDSFPLIEGEFQLNVLVQNSVGKEFCLHEGTIKVPSPSSTPKLMDPVLGYGLKQQAAHLKMPFKSLDKKLLIDPKNTFSLTEKAAMLLTILNVSRKLWEDGALDILINGLGSKNSLQKTYSLKLNDYPYSETLSIPYFIPIREFQPDYYELKIILKGPESMGIDQKKGQFIISPKEFVPHPLTLAKAFPLANSFLYFYSLAYQYDKFPKPKKASALYAQAYALKPDYVPGIVEYARFLLRKGEFERSLAFIEQIKSNPETEFQYYLIKGKALMGKADYFAAITSLLKANTIYNSDTDLLGSLGYCYYKRGENDKAIAVLKSALRLNPELKNIQALLSQIEKHK